MSPLRHWLLPLATLLALACDAAPLQRIAPSTLRPTPVPRPTPAPEEPPPVSASSLDVEGYVNFAARDPEVVVVPAPGAAGRGERLRIELRHRAAGSSTPDSILTFLNVPLATGTYRVHAPAGPLSRGVVYGFFTTRSDRVGSMRDFTDAVTGTLSLERTAGDVLVGRFELAAQEPPPAAPTPRPGEPPPAPTVGTAPPQPPGRIEARGSFLALVPAELTGDSPGR